MKRLCCVLLFSIVPTLASAATLIDCVDDDGGPVLRLLITGRRAIYNVGGHWTMLHRGNEYPHEHFTATARTRRNGNIEIDILHAMTPTGPVGKRLLITPHESRPTLTEFNVGGFIGNMKLGEFKCTRRTRYCGSLLDGLAK